MATFIGLLVVLGIGLVGWLLFSYLPGKLDQRVMNNRDAKRNAEVRAQQAVDPPLSTRLSDEYRPKAGN